MAVRRELPTERAVEADRDERDAPGDVRAVEAGEGEEHGREDAVPREEAEARVLIRLAADEPDTEDERRDEPLDHPVVVALADGAHRELHGHARGHELDRVDEREPLPRGFLAEDRLPRRDLAAKEEVRREQRGEEHDLAADEHDDRPHPAVEPRRLLLVAGVIDREAVDGGCAATSADDRAVGHQWCAPPWPSSLACVYARASSMSHVARPSRSRST